VDDQEARTLLGKIVSPRTLKDIKDHLKDMPDEHLERYVVFRFCWGDEKGFADWKRKEQPRQYCKRIREEKRTAKKVKP
jgi:hypothetical protein